MSKFMAIYTGSPMASESAAPPVDEATIQAGMMAWGQWMQDHKPAIVDTGGPLGKTKRADKDGISDISNHMVGYVIVEAGSHEEAARMFEGHPHFAIFPGEAVEIMECMRIPGA